MKSRAAVAFGPGEDLKIVEIDVELPRKGEVMVEIDAGMRQGGSFKTHYFIGHSSE